MAGPEAERSVDCPRCGYDLRGELPTWAAHCPLAGRCTECGLDFAWSDLLSTKARRPPWCVEYAPRVVAVPWRCIKTFAVAFRPWRFWRTLRMHDEPRWSLITVYLLSLAIPVYVLFCTCNGLTAWRTWQRLRSSGITVPSPVAVIAQAVLKPTSDASPGTVTLPAAFGGPATGPYPAPSDVLPSPVDALPLLGFLGCLALFLVLCPVGFLALPISRRQAKVRPQHLVRITLYSVAFLVLIFGASIVEATFYHPAVVFVPLLFPAVIVVWWSVATGEHLRMRHAWGVGLAVVTMSALVTLICATMWVIVAYP
jgi:hypothetical protein